MTLNKCNTHPSYLTQIDEKSRTYGRAGNQSENAARRGGKGIPVTISRAADRGRIWNPSMSKRRSAPLA